jgi:hypothetical protein
MLKVGEVTFSLIPRFFAISWVRVVLPAPNSPSNSKKVLGVNQGTKNSASFWHSVRFFIWNLYLFII